MSFKHGKFEDSVTMRSLERVAVEKGLVKNDPLPSKTASAKETNLSPSDSLMENVIKLCAGLRRDGFDKYADQLENLFVIYKQADQNYNVSNEKGEDIIEFAHPEGGHQMENVDGDAYVEDILEKHLKMVDVADKDPKGKLASTSQVLEEVKAALAGASPKGFKFSYAAPWGQLFGNIKGVAGRSILGDPTGAGVSTEGTVGAGEVGAGEAAGVAGTGEVAGGGAAAGGAAGVGALAGAVLIGAVAGAITGNVLFETYLSPDQLREAGERLIEKAESFRDAQLWNDPLGSKAEGYLDNFKAAFSEVMASYGAIQSLQKNPSRAPLALQQLKKLDDALLESGKWAQELWSFADSKMDEKTFSFRWSPLTNYQDIVVLGGNYLKLSNRIHALISKFVYDANMALEEKMKSSQKAQIAPAGGEMSASLSQQYQDTLNTIDRFSAAITARRQPNMQAILDYLNKIQVYVKSEQNKFNKIAPVNREVSVPPYQDRLNKAKSLLSAIKSKQEL